jgi:hypothetical protein
MRLLILTLGSILEVELIRLEFIPHSIPPTYSYKSTTYNPSLITSLPLDAR